MSSNEAPSLHPVPPPVSIVQPREERADEDSLRRQLLQESDAMARYAFSAGLKVPAEVLQSLQVLEELKGEHGAAVPSLVEIAGLHA